MNRLVWDGETRISATDLPPERRVAGGPARVLFLHGRELGFGTTAKSLELFCAGRADIDAVHVSLALPAWARALGKELPKWLGGWDFHNTRMTRAFGASVERAVRAHLPLHRFDVVHIMTRERATLVTRAWARGPRYMVNIDATLAAWDRAFGMRRSAPKIDYATDKRILAAADAVACASRWVMESAVNDYGLSAQRYALHMPCAPRVEGAPVRDPRAHVGRAGPLRVVFVGNDFKRKGGERLLRWWSERWRGRVELHICSGGVPAAMAARMVPVSTDAQPSPPPGPLPVGGGERQQNPRLGAEEGRLNPPPSPLPLGGGERIQSPPPAPSLWEGVQIHGRVEHGRLVREVLPSMDLCVIPTWEDTFLIAAQEAQAAGLPVVSSRLAGIPEVVADGETGTLCAREDDAGFIAAVERYLDEPGLLERQSRAAAARGGPGGALEAAVWHHHLLNQMVALADNRPVRFEPEQLLRQAGADDGAGTPRSGADA